MAPGMMTSNLLACNLNSGPRLFFTLRRVTHDCVKKLPRRNAMEKRNVTLSLPKDLMSCMNEDKVFIDTDILIYAYDVSA